MIYLGWHALFRFPYYPLLLVEPPGKETLRMMPRAGEMANTYIILFPPNGVHQSGKASPLWLTSGGLRPPPRLIRIAGT